MFMVLCSLFNVNGQCSMFIVHRLMLNVYFSKIKVHGSILNILFNVQYCPMFNGQYSMLNIHAQCSIFTVQYHSMFMFNVHVQCSMFMVHCSMFNIQGSLFNVQCSCSMFMFNVQYSCSVFNIHCSMLTLNVQCSWFIV